MKRASGGDFAAAVNTGTGAGGSSSKEPSSNNNGGGVGAGLLPAHQRRNKGVLAAAGAAAMAGPGGGGVGGWSSAASGGNVRTVSPRDAPVELAGRPAPPGGSYIANTNTTKTNNSINTSGIGMRSSGPGGSNTSTSDDQVLWEVVHRTRVSPQNSPRSGMPQHLNSGSLVSQRSMLVEPTLLPPPISGIHPTRPRHATLDLESSKERNGKKSLRFEPSSPGAVAKTVI